MPTNWARSYTYSSTALHVPGSVDELCAIVARAAKVKVLGTGHSFNGIADTTGEHVSLEKLGGIALLDHDRGAVTVEGGVAYHALCTFLEREGLALHNLASLPHISVAGAVATASHGSGDTLPNLAAAVRAIELVTAEGDVVELSRDADGERFLGAVVSLGVLGVVTKLTLDVVPSFAMRQYVYEDLPMADLEERFDALMASAYSVSLFTDWREQRFTQVWVKERIGDRAAAERERTLFEATLASGERHPIATVSAASCTPQMGLHGPWHERLPHFRAAYVPSSGDELQSEYLVPRRHACAALRTLARLGEQIAPLLHVSEVRTIAADDLWMSPCRGEPCISVHFTWHKDWAAVRQLLPLIERELEPLEARPHWGKLSAMEAPRVQALFPKLAAFRDLARELDPRGKLRNAFVDALVFAGG